MDRQWRYYQRYRSPYDPCPPRNPSAYIVPPNQFIVFQQKAQRQFTPREALKRGTLWPDLYSPYNPPKQGGVVE